MDGVDCAARKSFGGSRRSKCLVFRRYATSLLGEAQSSSSIAYRAKVVPLTCVSSGQLMGVFDFSGDFLLLLLAMYKKTCERGGIDIMTLRGRRDLLFDHYTLLLLGASHLSCWT